MATANHPEITRTQALCWLLDELLDAGGRPAGAGGQARSVGGLAAGALGGVL
jgi:hypothetical protein